ncbi:glycosyltransferase [Lentzea tibetensis]|uniref:Glycosyltransferase n=1 Tax=Lentzea tibetensis TaxID=2591470 RepID=A0A563EY50_9PSEU|nr:glycosyltransferase [Lentzea tibetensis]TWP52411.1 glycosyltransferase [Lentzea tibetensis]
MTAQIVPVKVVQVLGTLDRGGVETIALRQCRDIPPEHVRQVFVTLGTHEGMLAPEFRAAGAEVVRCPVRPKWTFPMRLWHLLRRIRPDVVESHVSLTSGLVLAVASAARVKVRIARLRSEGDGRGDAPLRRLQRRLLRELMCNSATSVLGVTRAALTFAGPPPHDYRYQVVPNQVDVERFASARRAVRDRCAGPVMTHIGRASPEKNRGFLLGVHTEARRLRPDVRLTVVGPGGIEDLAAVAPRVASDPSVRLLGPTDRVEEVLAATDVLLLPSHREGLPNVVLEALAAGVPVLAADLPGLRELSEQVHGLYLLSLRAGAAAWANTALTLAGTPESERDRISEGIRRSPFALSADDRWWRTVWTAHR